MIQTLKKLILKYQELIRYVIVGGITTAVNLGMYLLLKSEVSKSVCEECTRFMLLRKLLA